MKIIYEPGDLVRINKTGEVREVNQQVENMTPPLMLYMPDGTITDDQLYMLDEVTLVKGV